ncbi:MAG: ABC transporter ATP-binding protein/permease [Desulfovibrionaceae bacterium]
MVTKRPITYWIKNSNKKLQTILLFVIIVTVFARLLPLEMQKKVVNEAIGMKKLDLLYLYCGIYLAAVIVASGLKYVINILQTYIGQQSLAQLRKDLYSHILTLPLSYFRKANPGMVVSSLVSEVASTGELVGMSIAVTVTNTLTLLAFSIYLFYLNWLLALLTMILYPIIMIVVPRLQVRTNRANKERVDVTRNLSSSINEAINGIHEVHGNGSHHIENNKYSEFVDQLFRIRIVWILYKHGIKVLNNFFQNLGPFFLFIVGGWLAINGRFDLGALVAFLSANEKLLDPWKELMDFYQVYQDATTRYERVMEYFDGAPEAELEPVGRDPYELNGHIVCNDLGFTVPGGIQLLKQVNLELKPGEQLALVGFSGSGKSTLAQCVSQLYAYTHGSVEVDGREVAQMTKKDIASNFSIVAQSPFIFSGSIRDNLLYGCRAVLDPDDPDLEKKLPDRDDLIEALQQVGIYIDVLRFGMNTVIDPELERELADRLIKVRANFQADFGDELADAVEFFEDHSYLHYSSVADNLTFGHPRKNEFLQANLPSNQFFLEFLDQAQLTKPLLSLGRELATQTVDILGNLTPDEAFFRQSPINIDEFDQYKDLVRRLGDQTIHNLDDSQREMLLHLGLRYIPGRHKMVALPTLVQSLILDGRALFMQRISETDPEAYSFYRSEAYIDSLSILENILFGRPKTESPKDQERINQSLMQLLIEEDLLERVLEIGMEFQVGTKGDRLSGGQCQKLAIARSFLKNSPILIMDEATSALDNASQQRIQNILESRWKGKATLIAVVHRLDTIKGFDKVAVMKAGKIVEMDSYENLMKQKGVLHELVHGADAGS